MSAALAITPASGSITAKTTATKVNVTGGSANTAAGVPIYSRIRARLTGYDDLVSHQFGVSSDGKHEWDNVIFPAAGTWTVTLRDTADDSQLATMSVVVA